MSFDEIFDLTAGVYFNFYNIYIYVVSTVDYDHVAVICIMLAIRLTDAQHDLFL